MKERTKQILRYVACGLGGLALGIGLLGGLSMCATSANKNTESVNTIYANPRRAQITTTNGGYTGYKFEIPTEVPAQYNDGYKWTIYALDYQTYTPSVAQYASGTLNSNTRIAFLEVLNTAYTRAYDLQMSDDYKNSHRLLLTLSAYSDPWQDGNEQYYAINYTTFVERSYSSQVSGYSDTQTCFLTSSYNGYTISSLSINSQVYSYFSTIASGEHYYLTSNKTNNYFFSAYPGNSFPQTLVFQDVQSYYQELGYQDGYDNGHDTGFDDGYADGYDFGYSIGHTTGYSEGYDDAYAEKDSGIAFTSCGVYPNAHVTLQTDETIGNFNYMYLCHYITKPGYDEHTIYILWTRNAQTGQYLGEVIDRNDSDSYDPAVTLGSFTQEVTPSVTITATEDMEFGLWVGYITTFHNRGEITNSILWFQGGTAESDMQIYQNGYDEGYQNGNQAGQETGYEQGYERGQEVGDAEGYSRGYTEGFNQTNTKNVFSLFTSAFDSVASFFDLKIFGFLPLYWFFLAPLFIALISLLMRMVKH